MTWSTGRTRTWARPLSAGWPRADSFTPASCPSTRSQAPGWCPARCRPTASLALRRSRMPRSRWRRNGPNWSTAIPRVEQGWTQMREDRAAFVEFFGGDELVLPPAEAEERLNAYYRHRQEAALARQPSRRRPPNLPSVDAPAFEFPPELADADTIGMIYDETDGLNFYNEYGMLRALFADPALAADKRFADMLREYLRAETIGPLPFRRLAAAHPVTADAVFRKVLRKPNFTWAKHGEALMRRRKPWYYEHEPRPGISVIGARLSELIRR